jgi:hypothetical protein
MEQGFITGAPDLDQEREHRRGTGGGVGEDAGPVKFEVTDKALDFLVIAHSAICSDQSAAAIRAGTTRII